jgi:hypothetical protein
MVVLMLEAWSRRLSRPIRLSHGIAEPVQCPLPYEALWSERDKCLIQNLPVVQYVASHSCPDQPGARMLSRLHEWLV